MKSLLTWTERRLPRLFRKLSNRQNFHLKAEMFSFHSKYFVYRKLKKAPQKLSFCFKCPDTAWYRPDTGQHTVLDLPFASPTAIYRLSKYINHCQISVELRVPAVYCRAKNRFWGKKPPWLQCSAWRSVSVNEYSPSDFISEPQMYWNTQRKN